METEKLTLTPQDVNEQVEGLMGEKNIAPEYLRLFCELFAAEYKTEQKLRLKDLYPPLSRAEINGVWQRDSRPLTRTGLM